MLFPHIFDKRSKSLFLSDVVCDGDESRRAISTWSYLGILV